MKRPTIKQLNDVRFIAGNGWGDGDILEYYPDPKDKRRVRRSLQAFESWLEHLQGARFTNPTVAGKRRRE